MVKKSLTSEEYKLYEMIYMRALASIMAPAKLLNTSVSLLNNDYLFKTTGSLLRFDGYLKVYSKYEIKKILSYLILKFIKMVKLKKKK